MQSNHTNNDDDFYFEPVNVSSIQTLLSKLNSKKATGPDMLPAKLLKCGSDIMCYPVCYLLNMCFTQGIFPSTLKYANVSPIYKKGNSMDVCNYRTVSVIPSMSKFLKVSLLINYLRTLITNLTHVYQDSEKAIVVKQF